MKLQYHVGNLRMLGCDDITSPYRYIDYSQLFRGRDGVLLHCIYIISVITAHYLDDVSRAMMFV